MNPPPVTFRALRRLGKGRYRIVWFGNVVRSATAVGVVVVFAPYKVEPSSGELLCDLRERVPIILPVAYLRQFRLGDIWEDGVWTGLRDTQAREIFELNITTSSVAVMPAGVPLNREGASPRYLLPFSIFEGHRDHTQAQCARILLNDGAVLAIPCMELIRFYFGASGGFLKRLFSGSFSLDQLYSGARINRKTQAAHIHLADGLPGVAAATVARIAFCAQAKSAARWVSNTLVVAAAGRREIYPKTTLPFFGETSLTARGAWFCHDGVNVFFAEQIVSCTHPFPFKELFYSSSRESKLPAMGGNDGDHRFSADGKVDRPDLAQVWI